MDSTNDSTHPLLPELSSEEISSLARQFRENHPAAEDGPVDSDVPDNVLVFFAFKLVDKGVFRLETDEDGNRSFVMNEFFLKHFQRSRRQARGGSA